MQNVRDLSFLIGGKLWSLLPFWGINGSRCRPPWSFVCLLGIVRARNDLYDCLLRNRPDIFFVRPPIQRFFTPRARKYHGYQRTIESKIPHGTRRRAIRLRRNARAWSPMRLAESLKRPCRMLPDSSTFPCLQNLQKRGVLPERACAD